MKKKCINCDALRCVIDKLRGIIEKQTAEWRADSAKKPDRERLPDERASFVRRFEVVKSDGSLMRTYACVGLYPDGRPGELFLHADKVGTTAHGALDAAAIAISIGLQYGVPLKVYTDKLKGTRFGPEYGKFGDEKSPRGASVLALVASWLEEKFLMEKS